LRGLGEQHDEISARFRVGNATVDRGVEALVADRSGARDHEEVAVAPLRNGDAHLGHHVGDRHEVLDAPVVTHALGRDLVLQLHRHRTGGLELPHRASDVHRIAEAHTAVDDDRQ
jgi:hypothetical protein